MSIHVGSAYYDTRRPNTLDSSISYVIRLLYNEWLPPTIMYMQDAEPHLIAPEILPPALAVLAISLNRLPPQEMRQIRE